MSRNLADCGPSTYGTAMTARPRGPSDGRNMGLSPRNSPSRPASAIAASIRDLTDSVSTTRAPDVRRLGSAARATCSGTASTMTLEDSTCARTRSLGFVMSPTTTSPSGSLPAGSTTVTVDPPARSSSTNMDPTAPRPPTTVAVPDAGVMAGSTRRTRGPARTPHRVHGAEWTP